MSKILFPKRPRRWSIYIPCAPRAMQSVRFTRDGRTYQPKDKVQYKQLIQAEASAKRLDPLMTGPVVLDGLFMKKYPTILGIKIIRQWQGLVPCWKRPDLHALVKIPEDALTGIVYADDRQVVTYAGIHKIYGPEDAIYLCVRELGRDIIPEMTGWYRTVINECNPAAVHLRNAIIPSNN